MMNKFVVLTRPPGSCGLCCTKIEHLGVKINNRIILEDINLHIHCGEITTIIGPNGAGKSTLLKALLGETPHSGEMKFLDAKGNRTGSPLIGYVPQTLEFDQSSPMSVYDLFHASYLGYPVWLGKPVAVQKRVEQALSVTHTVHLMHKKIGVLSGGELQRVLLALALDPVPDLLLLDEPVSGIDQAGLELFYEILNYLKKNYDLSIILVSHDLARVPDFSDRVALINHQLVYCGSPSPLFGSDLLYETFGFKKKQVMNDD